MTINSMNLRVLIILLFISLGFLSIHLASTLKFDLSFDSFQPKTDSESVFFEKFQNQFPSHLLTISLAIHEKKGGFNSEFLKKLHSFSLACRKISGVNSVQSITTINDLTYTPIVPIITPLIDLTAPDKIKEDSIEIMMDERIVNQFISSKGNTFLVLISLNRELNQNQQTNLISSLDSILYQYQFEEVHISGLPIVRNYLIEEQKKEIGFLGLIGVILIFLFMYLYFQNLKLTILATFSIILGMILFMGWLGWVGRPLDLMASIYPLLMLIIGSSDIIHILSKYIKEIEKGSNREIALKKTITEVGLATLLTTVTTAIGFASLYFSDVEPIKFFGLYSAVGVCIAYLTVILFTTSIISFFPLYWFSAKKNKRTKGLPVVLEKINILTQNYVKTIFFITAIFCFFCFYYISKISYNLHESRDLPKESIVLKDYQYFENEFNGINSITLALNAKKNYTFNDLEIQKEVEKLEYFVKDDSLLGSFYSPNFIFKLAHRIYKKNNPAYFKIADSKKALKKHRKIISKYLKKQKRQIISKDGKWGKMDIRVKDLGSENMKIIYKRIKNWNFDSEKLSIKFTGTKYIFEKQKIALVWSIISSLGIACIVVSFIMGLLFRSIKMVLISLIPNTLPLLITLAMIGFFGFELDPKIAIVFTIAFGIAVDDTIHFLSKFKLEKTKGKSKEEAIKQTFQETGKSILITSLILFGGFSILLLSNFPPTYIIGFLLSFTLLIALIADFFLIPILIRVWMKE